MKIITDLSDFISKCETSMKGFWIHTIERSYNDMHDSIDKLEKEMSDFPDSNLQNARVYLIKANNHIKDFLDNHL